MSSPSDPLSPLHVEPQESRGLPGHVFCFEGTIAAPNGTSYRQPYRRAVIPGDSFHAAVLALVEENESLRRRLADLERPRVVRKEK